MARPSASTTSDLVSSEGRPFAARQAPPGASLDARLRIATETGRLALWEFRRGRGVIPSPGLNRLLGFPADATPSVDQIEAKMPGELDRLRTAAFASMELGGSTFELEIGCERAPDDARWLLVRADILFGHDGQARGAIGVVIDITERKRAEERVRLLAREVDHRANNLLTVIEGIVALAQEDDAAALKAAIIGRIEALASAHRLMAASKWQGADLAGLVRQEVEAYRLANPGRVQLEGPDISLSPVQAQTLAMVFHELATNAAKYGALSTAEGRVAVSWTVSGGASLTVCWRESGGPRVRPPRRRGFGTSLIARALADSQGSRAGITWRPEGVVCEIELAGVNSGR